ncbi:MAG: carboxypeptidase regulatory-like domain-containing protein, partial [Prevotella sp.]|nr:carboxypeptidase regulatory-like domain-containing protein [Prevotella sp.]
GDSLSISGEVVNKAGKVVSHFSTSHHGLGRSPLSVKAGEQYKAVCRNAGGQTFSFPLPPSRNDVACLQCRQRSDDIQVVVNCGNKFPTQNLHLLVHCRGQIVSYQDIRPGSLYHLSPTSLPAGVNSVLLIDDEAHVLSERLIFSENSDINMPLTIESSKQKYDIRDSIPLQLSLPGLKEGEFAFLSLSVTDDGITRGSHSPSLWSQLLLSSDIQGYIPQADDYFSPVWHTDKLDLLMMVNGWRRYDMPAVLQGNYTYPMVEHERSQSVKGRVRAVFKNQPVDSVQVSLAVMKQRYVNGTVTDSEGRFEFDNLNFTEDADAYVYALRKKDRRCLVEIDQQRPPFTPDILKSRGSIKWIPWLNIDDELLQSYSQDSHLLQEVVVKGQAPTYMVDQPNMSFDRNSIKEGKYADLTMLLLCTNCLYLDNENELIKLDPAYATSIERLSMAGSSNNALDAVSDATTDSASGGPYASWPTIRLYVNGSEVPNASFNDISLTDVERVDLYLGNRAWIFGVTDGGVLDITIRGGLHRASDNVFNNKIVRLEGYQAPAEYYFPRYPKGSRPSEMLPDVRRTLYWNPYLRMVKDMPMHLDFYSADIPTTYTVRVEGVTSHGRIVSGTLPLTVKINN